MDRAILIRGVPVKLRDCFYLDFSGDVDPEESLKKAEDAGLLWLDGLNTSWDSGVLVEFALLLYGEGKCEKATIQAYKDVWRVSYDGEKSDGWIDKVKVLISSEFNVEATENHD